MSVRFLLCAVLPALALAAALPAPRRLAAQDRAAPGAATRPRGAAIALTARPALGAEFELELEQAIEVTSLRREGAAPLPRSPAAAVDDPWPDREAGPRRRATPGRLTRMRLFGRSRVEHADSGGVVMRSTLDSLLAGDGEAGRPPAMQAVPLPPAARTQRLRVAPDGAMTLVEATGSAAAVGASLSAMPPMLPDRPVRVGESWARAVRLPSLPFTTYRTDGVLETRFTLDSVSRGGQLAWVTMQGTMRRDGGLPALPAGTRVVTAGRVHGVLQFDRDRGWLREASTTVEVQSELVSGGGGTPPMHVDIHIEQRLRVR